MGQRAPPVAEAGSPFRPHFRWEPAPGEPQDLFPEPIGALPADDRAGLVLYERLRALKRAQAGPRRREAPKEVPPAPRRPTLPASRAREPIPDASSPSGTPLPGPAFGPAAGAGAGGSSGPWSPTPCKSGSLSFAYGEVQFCLPVSFVLSHLAGVGRSTVDDTLASLWGDFIAGLGYTGVTSSDIARITGCYNLDRDGDDYLFWDTGKGAPWRVHLYALQMLALFRDYIRDESSQHPCGAGSEFSDFIFSILKTGSGTRSRYFASDDEYKNRRLDNFRIHYLSRDPLFDLTVDTDTKAEQPCDQSAFYEESDPKSETSTCGRRYSEYGAILETLRTGPFLIGQSRGRSGVTSDPTFYDPRNSRGDSDNNRNGAPNPGCPGGGNAPDTLDRVRLQPSMLDFYGYVSDHVMFLARLALDYYFHSGLPTYYEVAIALSRHALNQILYHAGHITHEIGHVFCGSNHCAMNNCFMNHARRRMQCHVRAFYGLYKDSTDLSFANDGCVTINNVSCSSNATNPGGIPQVVRFCADGGTTTEDLMNAKIECGSRQRVACQITNPGSSFDIGVSYGSETFCMTRCTADHQTGWTTSNCNTIRTTSTTVTLDDGTIHSWNICS